MLQIDPDLPTTIKRQTAVNLVRNNLPLSEGQRNRVLERFAKFGDTLPASEYQRIIDEESGGSDLIDSKYLKTKTPTRRNHSQRSSGLLQTGISSRPTLLRM
jgi:hypothetical protein